MGRKCPRVVSRWQGASVSSIGRRHSKSKIPCQDASNALPNGESSFIVVSDGAGSARHSEQGASVAVEATIKTLQSTAPWTNLEQVQKRILTACRIGINDLASALACHESDLAATLAFAAVTRDFFVAGNLGDGVVVAFRGQCPEILLEPERGEFANETMFLTSKNANRKLRILGGPLEGRDGFAVMSDGAADSLYQRRNRSLAPALSHILDWFENESSSKIQIAIRDTVMPKIVDRTMDDCSLAVLKLVRLFPDNLDEKSTSFLKDIFGSGNKRGLRNRIRVLECIMTNGVFDNLEIAKVVRLSPSTVRNHRRVLDSFIID